MPLNKTLPLLLLTGTLGACASDPALRADALATQSAPPPAADREAILSMAGEFDVRFAFDETVPLAPGYERRDSKRSGAAEAVIVLQDDPDRIVLQHLLLVGDQVVKHWRQDWTWEASERLEFVADQTWEQVPLAAHETEGRWTQCVFEVSDAPRYCGTGRWNHRYGSPTWTSDRSWRPLPRREYTTREDYNALNVENRHTITPVGWTHEQDNSKVVREGGETREVLVREFGFNDYRRTEAVDFTPVYRYWEAHADYWAQVRATWQDLFDAGGVHIATDVDGMPVIEGLFSAADAHRESNAAQRQAAIDAVMAAHVRPVADTRSVAANQR
jgi:hypothetical protein